MSKVHKEKIICPKCQAEAEFEFWDSINVNLDPELREKIFDDSLFIFTCPKCGNKTCVPYSTLYHDMERNFMLFFDFFPPKDYDYKPLDIPDAPIGLDKSYTMRVVHGLWRLKEKILILEKGLNDIAIERMKYMLTHITYPEIAKNGYEVYFGGVDYSNKEKSEHGSMLLFYEDENDKPVDAEIAMDMYYENCLSVDLDPRMKPEGCMCVDEGWIARQLKKSV